MTFVVWGFQGLGRMYRLGILGLRSSVEDSGFQFCGFGCKISGSRSGLKGSF